MDADKQLGTWAKRLEQLVDGEMDQLVIEVVDRRREQMADMNRDQLEDGMRADGTLLPPYAPATVQIKREKGQQTQPMNLRDQGHFQAGIVARKYDKYLEMTSLDYKTGKLVQRFGEQILGISDENIDILRDEVTPELMQEFRKKIRV